MMKMNQIIKNLWTNPSNYDIMKSPTNKLLRRKMYGSFFGSIE
jgi:hypothetical protein